MKAWQCGAAVLAALGISGCATNWQHSSITDTALADRQFKFDDGYCLRVAVGAQPMLPIAVNTAGMSSSFSGQMSIYDTSTGSRSFGTYGGTVTPSPGASFTSGFSNGMAIGAAIQARRIQDQIHDECMLRMGWNEAPAGASRAAPLPVASATAQESSSSVQSTSAESSASPAYSDDLYPSAEAAWLAAVDEFMAVYPGYKTDRLAWDRLDATVRKIANERPDSDGPQILLAAHDSLMQQGLAARVSSEVTDALVADIYRKAVENSAVDQSALGLGFGQGWAPLPRNSQRARYWLKKSALAGNPAGQQGYGVLLFTGIGGAKDRLRGHWWVKKAIVNGDTSAVKMLATFEAQMSAAELEAARAQQ